MVKYAIKNNRGEIFNHKSNKFEPMTFYNYDCLYDDFFTAAIQVEFLDDDLLEDFDIVNVEMGGSGMGFARRIVAEPRFKNVRNITERDCTADYRFQLYKQGKYNEKDIELALCECDCVGDKVCKFIRIAKNVENWDRLQDVILENDYEGTYIYQFARDAKVCDKDKLLRKLFEVDNLGEHLLNFISDIDGYSIEIVDELVSNTKNPKYKQILETALDMMRGGAKCTRLKNRNQPTLGAYIAEITCVDDDFTEEFEYDEE